MDGIDHPSRTRYGVRMATSEGDTDTTAGLFVVASGGTRGSDTEKITINVVPVDLGKIDLLVDQGIYSSRSDLIRTAIRRVLDENAGIVSEVVTRRALNIGVLIYGEKDFAKIRAKNQRLRIRTIGRLVLRPDVQPDTADAVIEEIIVKGSIKMTPEVRERLADRIRN